VPSDEIACERALGNWEVDFRLARHPTSIEPILGRRLESSDDDLEIRTVPARKSLLHEPTSILARADLRDSSLKDHLPIQHHREGCGSV
jgi:hypothetical protein